MNRVPQKSALRAGFEIKRGAVFVEKAVSQSTTKETALRGSAQQCFGKLNVRAWEAHTPGGSSTEEQRRQTALSPKTLPPSLKLPPSLESFGGQDGGQAGRRVFCLRPALARSSQPAAGMLAPVRKHPRRLGHSQNPSLQHPS
jgi:hypothetical protein